MTPLGPPPNPQELRFLEWLAALWKWIKSLIATDLLKLTGNRLINPFQVNQRAPATNANDTYAHDRWNVLTQSNAIAVTTLTDVEDGLPYMARLTQSNVTAQRFGYSQIIEGINCKDLRGKTVTFRFGRVRLSTAANIRHAVLEWTGTVDAVTSDVVKSWTSTTYTANNFFLASNLTVSSVVQQTLAAATLTDGSAVTVTLGSTFNNLIVFTWVEAVAAQNVTLDLGAPKLEAGDSATNMEWPLISKTFDDCQRYAQVYGLDGANNSYLGTGVALSATRVYIPYIPITRFRGAVAVAVSAVGDISVFDGVTATACNAVAVLYPIPSGVLLQLDVAAGLTATGCYTAYVAAGAAKYLQLTSEL